MQSFGSTKFPVSLDPFHLVRRVQWGGVAVIVEATIARLNHYALQATDPVSSVTVPNSAFDPINDDIASPALSTPLEPKDLKNYRSIMYADNIHVETRELDPGGDIIWRAENLWGDLCYARGGIEAVRDGFTLFGDPRWKLIYGDPNSDAVYVGDFICGFIFNNDPGQNRNGGNPGGLAWDSHLDNLEKTALYSSEGKRIRRGVVLNDGALATEPPFDDDMYMDGGVKLRDNQWYGDVSFRSGPTTIEIVKVFLLVSFYSDLKTIKLLETGHPEPPEFPFSYTNTITLKAYSGGKFKANPDGSVSNFQTNPDGSISSTPGVPIWQATRSFDYLKDGDLFSFNEKGIIT